MNKLTFSDGMSFDTSGPLRTIRKNDGWYVVGQGMLIPVEDEKAAQSIIQQLSTEEKEP